MPVRTASSLVPPPNPTSEKYLMASSRIISFRASCVRRRRFGCSVAFGLRTLPVFALGIEIFLCRWKLLRWWVDSARALILTGPRDGPLRSLPFVRASSEVSRVGRPLPSSGANENIVIDR